MSRGAARTRRLSRLVGGVRVGLRYFEDRALLAEGAGAAPLGLVDRIGDLAHPGIDVDRVHPDVVAFFERTAELELHVRSAWRFPLSWMWPVLRPIMRWIGQFVLPRREARIGTRVERLAPDADGRADARAVIRTYEPSGEVFQIVAYATWAHGEARYMSAAFPMPLGQIAGLLRLEPVAADAQGRLAVALTSGRHEADEAGLWLVIGSPGSLHVAVPAPMSERLELWPTGMVGAPSAGDALPGATIVGRHEQRLLGYRFVTHHYAMRLRTSCASSAKRNETLGT